MIDNYLHLAHIVLCGQRWKTPPFTFADKIGMTDSSSFLSRLWGWGYVFNPVRGLCSAWLGVSYIGPPCRHLRRSYTPRASHDGSDHDDDATIYRAFMTLRIAHESENVLCFSWAHNTLLGEQWCRRILQGFVSARALHPILISINRFG